MSKKPPFYYFFCNHWTQGGIGLAFQTGWHKGKRYAKTFSSVYTVDKMLEAADQYPGLVAAMELDAHLYEEVAKEEPAVIEKLKAYIKAGKASIEGGTYSQPFGQDYGWEPNIRQLTYGRRTVRDVLDTEARAFLVEEQWFHPQLPQLLTKSGFKYASLQNQNSGRVKPMDDAVINWVGLDGSTVPTVPSNNLMISCTRQYQGYDEYLDLWGQYESPLITQWVEVWAPGYDWGGSCTPFDVAIKQVKELGGECVGLAEYFDKALPGLNPRSVYIPLDESNYYNAWYQGGGWGGDGDRVIVKDKHAEQRLIALETLSALASAVGTTAAAEEDVRGLWKRLFVLQNHDFSAARPYRTVYKGITTSSGEMGNAAYDELIGDAETAVTDLLQGLTGIGAADGVTLFTAAGVPGRRVVTVPVTPVLTVTQNGEPVPQQATADGKVAALVDLPAVGTVTLGTAPARTSAAAPSPAAKAALTAPTTAAQAIDDGKVRLEWVPGKRHLAITEKATGLTVNFEPFTGPSGHLNEHNAQYPALNPGHKVYAFYFKSTICAPDWMPPIQVQIVESGPVRSVMLLRQDLVTFHTTEAVSAFAESRVTLEHATGRVGIESYLYAGVPMGLQCEAIFSHNVPGARYFRDFAFGEEETHIDDIYANTYFRVEGEKAGFTLVHGGSQKARLTRRAEGGALANLIARDKVQGEYHWRWAIHFGQHQPHESARLVKAEHGWTAAHQGTAPATNLVRINDEKLILSALYREAGRTFIRLVNYSAEPVTAQVRVGIPFSTAAFTDFEGNRVAPAAAMEGAIPVQAQPWEIITVALS